MDDKIRNMEIPDEDLDQATGGNGGEQDQITCPESPNGQHVFQPAGFGECKCKYCNLTIGSVPKP